MQTTNRVALNTIIQYVKLLISLCVGLISVRVLLNALGAEDYGIYDVVGGIIALLAFINSSLSQSSIRFLSVSLGKNDLNDTKTTFNNCFWIHLLVSLLIVLLFELFEQIIFDKFLSIPEHRLSAAKTIYHFMVAVLFLQISITPFNALIVSHEKFVYISLIAILDSLLKLAIAFIIKCTDSDKLILYGGLMLGVTVLNSILSVVYVLVKYRSEFYVGRISLEGTKGLVSFVGWTILDIISQLSTRQGYAVIFNRFFGAATNAVYALSRQIEGNLYYVSASVIDSMKPQIMKSYGEGDPQRMIRLSLTAGKIGFSMMAIIAVPLLVMMPTVLRIWLVTVPEGTVFFARMMVVACMMEQLTRGLVYTCQATGDIKLFSIIVSTVRFLALPLSIIAFMVGCKVHVAMIIYVICEATGSFARVIIISRITDMRVSSFINSVLMRILPPVFVAFSLCKIMYRYSDTVMGCIINGLVSVLVYSVLCYVITLDKREKESVKKIVSTLILKIRK